jgi:Kae1-associated kinase Bud32
VERRLIKVGAEASLNLMDGTGSLEGKKLVEKTRLPKRYRNADIDERLSLERLKTEAKLMSEVRGLGISVPIIFDINVRERKLVMEFIDGKTVKDVLNSEYGEKNDLCRRIGECIGELHKGDIVHGDLTTSNMMLSEGRLYFIDFSMGAKSKEIEDKGVDLHLLFEALKSSHPELPEVIDIVLDGYRMANPDAEAIIGKMEEIEKRGRYT